MNTMKLYKMKSARSKNSKHKILMGCLLLGDENLRTPGLEDP